jgi:hypothetical protein
MIDVTRFFTTFLNHRGQITFVLLSCVWFQPCLLCKSVWYDLLRVAVVEIHRAGMRNECPGGGGDVQM